MTAPTSINTCGHPFNPPRTVITARFPDEVTRGNVPQIASIKGGRRVLVVSYCDCGLTTYYRQAAAGLESRTLENDRESISSALAEVLAEPTDVFTVDFAADLAVTAVIPRHHLPLLAVEQW